MKITITVKLEGNVELPVSAEVETLNDLKKLGQKLAALPAGANKLVPGMGEREVKLITVDKERERAAAAA